VLKQFDDLLVKVCAVTGVGLTVVEMRLFHIGDWRKRLVLVRSAFYISSIQFLM